MPTNTLQPRGLRNCNPCNIRKSATKYMGEIIPSNDRAFKQFKSTAWGYRAVFVLLDSYRRKGYDTVRKMINRWAPPCENDTESYIRTVCRLSHCQADEAVDTGDRDTMVFIVSAMSRVENGVPADISDVIAGWDLFQTHRP